MANINLDDLPRTRKEAMEVGSKIYFTGKTCGKGHISPRRTSSSWCIECARAAGRAWSRANPDKMKKWHAAWHAANPEKARETRRAWVAENRERLRAANRSWEQANPEKVRKKNSVWHATNRANNPDKVRDKHRAWRSANPEKAKRSTQAWLDANPEKNALYARRRRALERCADGDHSTEDIKRIRLAQKDKCGYCGASLKRSGHVDHIKPLSKGGSNWPNNLQLLCAPCNLSKATRDPIDFAKLQGRLI